MFSLTGAVDIGGTKIAAGLVTRSGEIVERAEWPTKEGRGPETTTSRIADWFASQSLQADCYIEGVGIACTGPVDPLTGIVGDVDLLPGWNGFNLVRAISEQTGCPARMENDADAAALAEYYWGAGKGDARFLYLTVSTGIGSGFVVDGRLYRGAGGCHPEAGHFSVHPSGPVCYCGTRGCLESMASGPAMVEWMREHEDAVTHLTARDICERARNGEELAREAVRNVAHWLEIGLATLVTVYGPGTIALGGGVMESHDLFLESIRKGVRTRCKLVPFDVSKIVPAELGKDAALIGAARVWQSESKGEKNTNAA